MDRGGYPGSLIRGNGTPIVGSTVRALAGVAYGEAGIGFSLGISSLTRLNEPRAGVGLDDLGEEILSPPTISLTDADGTTHLFHQFGGRLMDEYGISGIHLRRYGGGG